MIDVAELVDARRFLATFAPWQLGQLAEVLLPAAEARQAGSLSLLVLSLIANEIGERLETDQELVA